jgi:hypothetical protein
VHRVVDPVVFVHQRHDFQSPEKTEKGRPFLGLALFGLVGIPLCSFAGEIHLHPRNLIPTDSDSPLYRILTFVSVDLKMTKALFAFAVVAWSCSDTNHSKSKRHARNRNIQFI